MSWGNPNALYLLFLIPLFVLLMFIFVNQRRKQLLKFCDEKLLDFHNKNFSNFYFNLKTFVLILAFGFLVIAMARPQWDREVRMVETLGQDIVFLIDVSKSMDAQDILPSRLERAKTHIGLFLDELRGDRVAIIAFAGSAVLICPLTTDYAAAKLLLSHLSSDTVTHFGTDIGDGLRRAAEVFDSEARAKTIILLTDGEDLEEDGVIIARELAQDGIVVYTIGIGTPEGSPIMIRNDRGQMVYATDDDGNVIITRLDVLTLHRISEVTSGQFFMITPAFSEIYEVLRQIHHNERTRYATRQFFRFREQYHYFLILALILIILEGIVSYRQKTHVIRRQV